jgi:hypothetical protein
MTDRKKPGVAFWAGVAVAVLLVAYPLSFGPVCWLNQRTCPRSGHVYLYGTGYTFVAEFYRPILTWMALRPPGSDLAYWYAEIGTRGRTPMTIQYAQLPDGRVSVNEFHWEF